MLPGPSAVTPEQGHVANITLLLGLLCMTGHSLKSSSPGSRLQEGDLYAGG